MRPIEFILKLNGKFPVLRKFSQAFVKKAVLNPKNRVLLNNFYHKLSYYEKSIFHALYGRIFRDGKEHKISGDWILKFAEHEIKIPLTKGSLWLDWETALSILGHDYEIKAFYEKKICSKFPPKCFLDIGANFGTHSLLFLSAGIKTISVEPNPECRPYFERIADYNGINGNWNAIGLGKENGNAKLVFPEGETWLGSFNKEVKESLNSFQKLNSYYVEIMTLDEFIDLNEIFPDIIKIDTEGFEESILFGGIDFFKQRGPITIFEANTVTELKTVASILKEFGYSIYGLKSNSKVAFDDLEKVNETNFMAKKITEILK